MKKAKKCEFEILCQDDLYKISGGEKKGGIWDILKKCFESIVNKGE